MLVDSHCHLNYEGLVDDIHGTIERAMNANVQYFLSISTKITDFASILETAETYSNVACTVGIHPHETAAEPQTDARTLIEYTNHSKVLGIGETGLDFYYDNAPRGIQETNFRNHIKASRETQLPVIIHTREADERTIQIINEEQKIGHFPGLIHCFSAGKKLAECAVEHGMSISLSGIITFKTSENLRKIVKNIPLDNILLETDAPFLAPVPHRGKTNEPSFITHTAAKAAEIFGIDDELISKITTDNFFKLFKKAKRPF